MEKSTRNLGLDLIRSLAIFMVLISHSVGILHIDEKIQWMCGYIFGFYGVELFFVLSGFLIGRILLSKLESLRQNDFRDTLGAMKGFWLRRWFRTLPMYWLTLVISCVLYAFVDKAGAITDLSLWRFLLFLQNYSNLEIGVFPVSWSLCVEEWFYLTIPVVLLLVYKGTRHTGWAIGLFIISIAVLRAIYVAHAGADNIIWDSAAIRKNVFLRLDSIGIGVFLAYIFLYRQIIFTYLSSRYALLLGLGSLSAITACFGVEFLDSYFAKTFLFDVVTIAWGLIMCYSYSNIKEQIFGGVIIRFVSKISYSLYLVHFPIFVHVAGYSVNIASLTGRIGVCILSWVIAIGISALVYKYYEYPMMNLRDRFARP